MEKYRLVLVARETSNFQRSTNACVLRTTLLPINVACTLVTMCLFKRVDSEKYLLGRVIQVSYLNGGNETERCRLVTLIRQRTVTKQSMFLQTNCFQRILPHFRVLTVCCHLNSMIVSSLMVTCQWSSTFPVSKTMFSFRNGKHIAYRKSIALYRDRLSLCALFVFFGLGKLLSSIEMAHLSNLRNALLFCIAFKGPLVFFCSVLLNFNFGGVA